MSDIIVRTFKCTGCGEARPCTLTTTQAKAEIAFFDPAEYLECVLDKSNKTAHNWKEVQANGDDKSTEPALHKHIVSVPKGTVCKARCKCTHKSLSGDECLYKGECDLQTAR